MEAELEQGAEIAAALGVYLEPLADGARVLVLGSAALDLGPRLLALGARSVQVCDPDVERAKAAARRAPRGVTVGVLDRSLELRGASFDLAVLPDLGALVAAADLVAGLRRVLDERGSVIAIARARVEGYEGAEAFVPEIAEAGFDYAELYDTFADHFDNVTLAGILPFRGVVFAELGAEDPAVSVDTRLGDGEAPTVFVVAASDEPPALEPYAIVQVAGAAREADVDATMSAMQMRADLLSAQLDEQRSRLAANEARGADAGSRLELLATERAAALQRATELEEVLVATQQSLGGLERRVILAEQGMLERDDRIARLSAELEVRASSPDPTIVVAITSRADQAEAALALHVRDLAQLAEAHAAEVLALEEQLRERAGVIAALEREISRREQLVKELVSSLEDQGGAGANGVTFEAAAPLPAVDAVSSEEVARLRKKIDEMAFEIARREAELVAREWKLSELEAGRNEIDALRQALMQEHAARVAAESGGTSDVDTP